MTPTEPPRTARTAAEWADDLNEMLRTYSPMPDDLILFAQTHGVIAGVYVELAEPWHIAAECGWDARYDTTAGRWHGTDADDGGWENE